MARCQGRVIVRLVAIRTVIEHGPKDKKVVAFAPDWPGWSRGAASAAEARVRLAKEFDAEGAFKVVEEKVGTGLPPDVAPHRETAK